MSYTHEVLYTKNMLDGPLHGSQLYGRQACGSAAVAARIARDLSTGGVFFDYVQLAPFTAHGVYIRSAEPELPEIDEYAVDYEGAYDAADLAFDLELG